MGCETDASAVEARPGQTGMGSPGRRTFLPGPLSPPPLPYTLYPELHEWAERAHSRHMGVWVIGSWDSGPERNGLRPGEPISVWPGRAPHCTWSVSHPTGQQRSPNSGCVCVGGAIRGLPLTQWTTSTRPGWHRAFGDGRIRDDVWREQKKVRLKAERGNHPFMTVTPAQLAALQPFPLPRCSR